MIYIPISIFIFAIWTRFYYIGNQNMSLAWRNRLISVANMVIFYSIFVTLILLVVL